MATLSQVTPLTGGEWLIAIDPRNAGQAAGWFGAPRPKAAPVRVPGVMQERFPEYHGVAWYWRDFVAPAQPHADGRYLLRFQAVDYLADVWVNGVPAGRHEGAEEPFELDVTEAMRPVSRNRLAVRVLNPTDAPIDGMRLCEVPEGRRENGIPCDNACNTGGILDAVDLLTVPVVRIENLHVTPDWETGAIRVRATLRQAGRGPLRVRLHVSAAPAAGGESVAEEAHEAEAPAGDSVSEIRLRVPDHQPWELNAPILYRVTARVQADGAGSADERSVRCGFRDFRFERGAFRLNGRRIRLHGALYTVLHYPVAISVPPNEDFVRRDVLNMKMAGFNCVRITCGAALPARQLELYDAFGLLVCEEHFGADANNPQKRMAETPWLEARWDRSIGAVIRRDRNHPCVVMWSLLNEVRDGRLFRHAAASLGRLRELDDSRIVLLNSGRFDADTAIGSWSRPGSTAWESAALRDLHGYPNIPHTAETLLSMRGLDAARRGRPPTPEEQRPMLLSEYGLCGAEDYPRALRHFEQMGRADAIDARVYRAKWEAFLAAWRKWRLEECWARPEDYFPQSQRTQALLVRDDYAAWSANPLLIGSFSSTQVIDAWFHGCGLTTYFRELKPGMADVYADISAPLRWSVFVEPVNVYRGTRVTLEAVLTDLDVLPPGDYPVRVEVIDPHLRRVHQEDITLTVAPPNAAEEPPFARPVYARAVTLDGPSGVYRCVVSFRQGAAAAGGETTVWVSDPGEMPAVEATVTLWGQDEGLAKWLGARGIRRQRFADASPGARRVILVSGTPPAGDAASAFRELADAVAEGATALFLTPETLLVEGAPERPPQPLRGNFFPSDARVCLDWTHTWYFRPDHWAKTHPIFEGLPAGGIMDYRFYREIISGRVIAGVPAIDEAVSGTIQASGLDFFRADLLVGVQSLGAGRFILNALHLRENLGTVPAAERLLRNMLNYAGRGAARSA